MKSFLFRSLVLAITVFVVPAAAWSADYGYTTASGNWSNGANWTNGVTTGTYPGQNPTADRAFIGGSWLTGMATTSDVTLDFNLPNNLSEVWVGGVNSSSGLGTFNIQGNFTTLNQFYVGSAPDVNGIVNHTSGTVSTNETWLGRTGADGEYYLSGGSLSTAQRLIVGINGQGTFVQSGGTVTVNNNTHLGFNSGDIGQYTISAGTLNANNEVWIAGPNPSTGVLNVSGTGVVNHTAGRFMVGVFGTGTVNQTGGTVNITSANGLEVAHTGGGALGTYNLSGGTLNVTTVAMNGNASSAINLSGTGNLVANTLQSSLAGKFYMTGGNLDANTVNFSLNNNGGSLSPGLFDVVDTTVISGVNTYTQTAVGNLAIDLASLGSRDLVTVGGSAVLDGTVTVNLVGAYLPNINDFWDVLTASSITDNGIVATSSEGIFAASIVGGNTLRLTYLGVIPEPSSMVLALLGVAGVIRLRKFRKR